MEQDRTKESNSNEDNIDKQSVTVQFLQEEYNMFKPLPTDNKDIVWIIEFCKKNIVNTDLILQQMTKEMIKTVHHLVHGVASEVVEKKSLKFLELIQQLRQDDINNEELEKTLGATHNMSQELLQRITGIISSSNINSTPSQNTAFHSQSTNAILTGQKIPENDNDLMPPPPIIPPQKS